MLFHLGHDDVHLSPEPAQCAHQLVGVSVDSDPAAIHEDLGGAVERVES